jgi:hypothetical protein
VQATEVAALSNRVLGSYVDITLSRSGSAVKAWYGASIRDLALVIYNTSDDRKQRIHAARREAKKTGAPEVLEKEDEDWLNKCERQLREVLVIGNPAKGDIYRSLVWSLKNDSRLKMLLSLDNMYILGNFCGTERWQLSVRYFLECNHL